jgi:MFS family permease
MSYRIWIMGLANGCRYGLLSALQAVWAGPLLVYGVGMSTLEAAHLLVLFGVSYSLGMPLLGMISDKLMTRKKIICCGQGFLTLLAVSFLGWTPDTPFWLVAAAFFVLPLLASCGNIVYAHAREISPPELAPAAITWVNMFPLLIGAVFIQFAGMFLPADVSQISHPQALSHLWILSALSLGLTTLAYWIFIPESPAMQALRRQKAAK